MHNIKPEDGGEIFLQKVRISPKYMALQPKRPHSSTVLLLVTASFKTTLTSVYRGMAFETVGH
jgi:hypothetical protein